MRSLGHIKETKDKGVYRIVLSVGLDPATGKRVRQWVTVKGTKLDAKKRLAKLLHELNSENYIKPAKDTVTKYLDQWLADYAKPNLSPKSFERYESIARVHLIPALGRIALTQLRAEHIQALYTSKLNAGLNARTVRYHHVVLHKALQTALKWGLISRNVSDSVDVPKAKITEMQTWDESTVSQFLEVARDSQYYALFYTALFTGMRRSELLALRWQDIDFIYSQIYINRALHQLQDGSYIFTQPKSSRGRRTIALPPSAILTLRDHHDRAAMDSAMLGVTLTDNDLVFSTIEGKPLRPNTISRAWQTMAAKASVKVIRFHDARHTHASLMLKQGVHHKVVQERLGHATIAITLDTYSHVAPGLQEAAAQRFDEAFQKPTAWLWVDNG
jgi:integrase